MFPDMPCMNLSNPKPEHTTGGAPQGGGAGQRGKAGREGRGGGGSSAKEIIAYFALLGTEDNRSGRLFGSTNKPNPV